MTRPLSNDLRLRLIKAVADGATCRAAAARFGIAPSTAVKLVRRWRDSGISAARPQGGDMRSERIEAYCDEILGLIAKQIDITLVEIAAHLEQTHAERFAPSTIWRFLDRHAQTYKKNRARQRAGTAGRSCATTGMARRTA